MKRITSNRPKGESGCATVQIKNKKVVVTFLDEDTGAVIKQRELPGGLPEGVNVTNAKYAVSLDSTNTELRGIRPWSGLVNVKTVDFVHKPNQPPLPKQGEPYGQTKDGRTYPKNEMKFTAIAKVVRGTYANMEIICPFIYASYYEDGNQMAGFADDGDGFTGLVGNNKDADKLHGYLEATGVADHLIPFSENVLPSYLADILEQDLEFAIVMADGWPQTYSALEAPRKKKKVAAKKAPAKKSKK